MSGSREMAESIVRDIAALYDYDRFLAAPFCPFCAKVPAGPHEVPCPVWRALQWARQL